MIDEDVLINIGDDDDSIKSIGELEEEKLQRTMETVAWRAGYYRANPQRYVEEVLGIRLKLFQKILIWAMMHYNYFAFIACRGLGKTYLTSLFACVRCILYPGTKIVAVSGTMKQANEILHKIQDDFMRNSPILRSEIETCKIGINDAIIMFKNGSWITTRTSTDTARGLRANVILVDEFRIVSENILNSVIRKFLTSERQPPYLHKPEYSHLKERNKEIYMTSAWFKSHWSYKKLQSYVVNFFDDTKKYFVCGLPYQLSIKENLLSKEQVEDEMSENDFNEISFLMEMACYWFGDTDGSLFKYEDLDKTRRIRRSLLPLEFYSESNPVPKPSPMSRRIISVDVALMASSKRRRNDASSIYINDAIRTDNTYQSNFVYGESLEGLTTDQLGITIMRYFYKYHCTDMVLDTSGIGLSIYDFLICDQYDPETGETYKALTCCNNDEMAKRCRVSNAERVIWSVKANAQFNSDICVLLRSGIKNGKVNMLMSELEVEEILLKELKQYKKLSTEERVKIKKVYAEVTLAVYEFIKLTHTVDNGIVRVKERNGMRKDRYSSIAYNFWCAKQLELELQPETINTQELVNQLIIRRGRYGGKKL